MADTGLLKTTPLNDRHRALGAKMVPFAGYDMPVQYPTGVLAEHLWTRASAGLFDVSHMGQCFIIPADGRYETAARALESLVPADLLSLAPGQQRYSQFTDETGGVLDDLMITRLGPASPREGLYLVVNAACKDADYAHMRARLPAGVALEVADDLALIAVQGPLAVAAVAKHAPAVAGLAFMTSLDTGIAGIPAHVSRTGYTGEDGVEISVGSADSGPLVDLLLADPAVKPIGLGARDSLRLEAGLCLYGHDLDVTTSPVEAALGWSIQKRRRAEGGFPGAERIRREFAEGPSRVRVGLVPEGRAPAREGVEIVDPATGAVVGTVTSGGFGPSLNGPLAMGYVPRALSAPGTRLDLIVRGKPLLARTVPLPFVPNRYHRPK